MNPLNTAPIPKDDPHRDAVIAQPEPDPSLRHIAVVGDTYTILLTGEQTAGRYCLIDMHVPPGGGPPLHRHDFEELFSVLDGEIEVTFRDRKQVVRAGETINIPANAPHHFTNASSAPARMHCMCSPPGQEHFFLEIGIPVPTRTSVAPELTAAEKAALMEKTKRLAPQYRTELL